MSPALELRDVSLGYGQGVIVREARLTLPRGQWLFLVGPNGCGKSTLLRAIAGLLPTLHGEILIAGQPLRPDPLPARQSLGFAPPPERLPAELSGLQALQLLAHLREPAQALDDALALAERLQLTPWLQRPISQYSLGTRQKLAALQALMGRPVLIVLDEVLNGLDPLASWTLQQILRERVEHGASVLLSSHALELAERCADRVTLLLGGRLQADWQGTELAGLKTAAGGLPAAVASRLGG